MAKKLGPADHGCVLSLDEYVSARYVEGFQYELIDGRLYVAPHVSLSEDVIEKWLHKKLFLYSHCSSGVINYLTCKARVFIPGSTRPTCVGPDLAAFCDFPFDRPIKDLRREDISPFLVVEVPSADDPDKDFVRNVDLFLRLPTIKEYWILDTRADPGRPLLMVHRRHGSRWRILDVAFGAMYTTSLLPGFKLLIDPHK